ncbi:MAG: pitrilysin family protein [Gemmatimonadota bacterium]|nr:pitrilysin family protein [Gemmatimonadota bacterium]
MARLPFRRWLLVVTLATASLVSPATGQEPTDPTPGERLSVREVTLDNGMRFLILPREGAPTASFVLRFGIGGVHEEPGQSGIVHLLEHMLFKGTTTIGTENLEAERALFTRMDAVHDTLLVARASGDSTEISRLSERIEELEDSARVHVQSNAFDRILTREGAQGINATTTSEATTYFMELPSNRTELWFVLEADRMQNPVFREFYSERSVVLEERRMRVDASPQGTLYERFLATAFEEHPYGRPVVGHVRDLERISRRDLRAYHRRYYTPNNAVAVIVGDIDPDVVEGYAQRYFGELAAGEPPPAVTETEPPQEEERRVEVSWNAEPALRIGWRVPSAFHEDAAAVEVLSSLLTGGRSSRLHRRLVTEERVATSVYSSIGPGRRFPGLLQIDVTPRAPHTPKEIEALVYEEIARLRREGPTPEELERVRNQVAASSVRRMRSNLGLAFQLAESESLWDDWRETFRGPERLHDLTLHEVRRAAERYLVEEGRTVALRLREDS